MKTWKPFKKEKAVVSIRIEGLDKKEKKREKTTEDRKIHTVQPCITKTMKHGLYKSFDEKELSTKENFSVRKKTKIKSEIETQQSRN